MVNLLQAYSDIVLCVCVCVCTHKGLIFWQMLGELPIIKAMIFFKGDTPKIQEISLQE